MQVILSLLKINILLNYYIFAKKVYLWKISARNAEAVK